MTTTIPTLTPLQSLAVLAVPTFDCNIAQSFPEGVHSLYLAMCGAVSFPSEGNTRRMHCEAELVSAAHGVTVDALIRWRDEHVAALTVAGAR